MDTPIYVLMALMIGFSFSALTFSIGFMLGKMQGMSITVANKKVVSKEKKVEEKIDTPKVEEIKKPTQSRIMKYPKPDEVRKRKALQVEDVFYNNLMGSVEKSSGVIDPKGLI